MTSKKLTLSLKQAMIMKARRISRQRKMSISAMFSEYIALLDEGSPAPVALPPLTQLASSLAKNAPPLPEDWDYRDELAEAIDNKYHA
jgi:hypothetical protein